MELTHDEIAELQALLRRFVDERDWGQFHTPKNLASAVSVESAELLEIFQWRSAEESAAIMEDEVLADRVREEIADVFGYVLRLADILGIDIASALRAKIEVNGQKYPIAKSRGSARKYTELT